MCQGPWQQVAYNAHTTSVGTTAPDAAPPVVYDKSEQPLPSAHRQISAKILSGACKASFASSLKRNIRANSCNSASFATGAARFAARAALVVTVSTRKSLMPNYP